MSARGSLLVALLAALAVVAAPVEVAAGDRTDAGDAAAAADGVGGGGAVAYRWPVRAPVRRPFEAPPHPYAAGHRGLDLALAPGGLVRAAGPGTVAHAGAVAGTVWVSVDHPDGLRTAYGPLRDVRVAAGQRLRGGDALGALAAGHDGLHVSVRRDGTYLDPAGVLGGPMASLLPARRARAAPVGPRRVDAVASGRVRSASGPPNGGPFVTFTSHVR